MCYKCLQQILCCFKPQKPKVKDDGEDKLLPLDIDSVDKTN